jgi:hypothetical protein
MGKQIFYHFLSSENAIADLKRKRIKVSTLRTLNDPFEFMPYRRYGLEERQPYNKVFGAVSKKWGILCFSQAWEEQLLWAHYGEKHQGVALGFEISEGKLVKVLYDANEVREKFNLTDDPEKNEGKFLNLAGKKFQEWKYEKEYRLLVRLKDCILESGMYFIPFGKNLIIKEIILGCRFDHKKNKEKVLKLANQLDAEIIPTRPGWQDYRIHQCGTTTQMYRNLGKSGQGVGN